MRWIRVSLQTKIIGLTLSLIFLIVIVLTSIFTYIDAKQLEEQKGRLALSVSKTVSFMPSVIHAFDTEKPSLILEPIAEEVRKDVGAEFIVIGNKEGIRYAHPIRSRIGKHMVGGDNYRALSLGEYYTSKAEGSLGPSLRGKSPIYNKNGEIIGIVSVGFMLDDIKEQILNKVVKVGLISLMVMGIGVIGSILLARNIRKDTMGLEPYQIASLYRERNAVIQSVKEGILVIDQKGRVTVMNEAARNLLEFQEDYLYKQIEDILPSTRMYEVLETGISHHDQEMILKEHSIIVNRTPVFNKEKIVGVVASFRDKTEIELMVNTLSEVRQYSEDLRAQTHEFTNKLYVLSGLLQLGHYEDAVEMIQSETKEFEIQNRILFDQITDKKVQAILLGKLGKASEKKVKLIIDPNSSLQEMPPQIELSHLITIISNLIDNAFEAVANEEDPTVSFFTTDLGDDVIFEITDNGPGIHSKNIDHLFERGFTSKTNHPDRGYGLSNVKDAVNRLAGSVEVQSIVGVGSHFTVYLPKQLEREDGHYE